MKSSTLTTIGVGMIAGSFLFYLFSLAFGLIGYETNKVACYDRYGNEIVGLTCESQDHDSAGQIIFISTILALILGTLFLLAALTKSHEEMWESIREGY